MVLLSIALGLFVSAAAGQTTLADGTVLSRTACTFTIASYDALVGALKARPAADPRDTPFNEEAFRRSVPEDGFVALSNGRVSCSKIVYASGGERVSGYVVSPIGAGPFPVVIYNRGGTGEFGALRVGNLIQLARLALQGYVVLGSQYRGADGGTGHDEYGGAEVQDVLALFPLARGLGVADMDNVFMWGDSRGGMMTYLALKQGATVRAAAVIGAPADLEASLKRRPEMDDVYRASMPEYATRKREQLRERSAIEWAERLQTPLLLMHGGADWRVSPDDSRTLARRLAALDCPHELVIYADDDHPLTRHFPDAFQRIVDWFARHRLTKP